MRTVPPSPNFPSLRSRAFVSASRVLAILQQKLGCLPTGDRGASSEYWVTPKGVRFQVADPIDDQQSAPVVSATGRRSVYYSYYYAAALIHHASWLVAHARPEDETRRAHDPAILLADVLPPANEPVVPRPVGDLADTIFII